VKHLGYRDLLIGIVVLYLLIIVVPVQQTGGPLRVAVLGVLLLMAVRTGRKAGALKWPALVLALAMTLATAIAVPLASPTVLICIAQVATAVLVLITIVVLVRTLLATGVIDGPAVLGVLCIYLLLGLVFSALHTFFGALIMPYLNGVGSPPSQSDTLYFSLITLTTVGYGDITPASNVARAIASGEALIGQLYLVSIVAAVVARFQPARERKNLTESGGRDDEKPAPTDRG
jgi:Ion channel